MIRKVEIRDLTHQFDSSRKLFDQLNAELPLNEIVFFDGGVGSGRSTLLKMLAALLIPQQGSVVINDQELSAITFEEFLPTRLSMGYSFEQAGLLNNRTLRENLLLPVLYHAFKKSDDEAKQWVDQICEQFNFADVAHKRPSAVSGSQRKACVIARAFALNPQLVILDEPFAGLNSTMIDSLKAFISEKRAAGELQHVFLTCQNQRDVEGWATKKIFVQSNQLVSTDLSVQLGKMKGAA